MEVVQLANKVLVTGAGGFIGHHLVTYLVDKGYWVKGVDIKLPDYKESAAHEFELLELRRRDNYWKFLVGSDKSHYLPYFLPQVYATEIGPPVEKIDQCVCMMSTSRGPEAFLLDAALNLTRLVKQLGQQQRKWSFAITGMIPERGLLLPDRIRPTGLLDSPYGILAESKAVALLSELRVRI